MKFLTICDGGNVRSVSMAFVLKELKQGHEAFAIGRLFTSVDTMNYLCTWADKIIIMEPHMIESVPTQWHKKIHIIDVGPDVYGYALHPDLMKLTQEGAYWMLNFPTT